MAELKISGPYKQKDYWRFDIIRGERKKYFYVYSKFMKKYGINFWKDQIVQTADHAFSVSGIGDSNV